MAKHPVEEWLNVEEHVMNSNITSVDTLEEMQEMKPNEYDYVVVKNIGVYYWDKGPTGKYNGGTILRLGDI